MSSDTPGDPRSRDTALARLLAEALKARSNPADRAGSSACPDAEILAAYADHGLAEDEAVRWESHFADCERCQKVIAVLAASGEELTPAEVQKLGTVAAASDARESATRGTVAPWLAIWRRPVLWRWLVPAAGLASAALWFALRQAPTREVLTTQKIETRSDAPQRDAAQGAAASSAKSDESQVAQANLPAPPPALPRPGPPLRDKETAPSKSVDAAAELPARKQESRQTAAQAPPVSQTDRLQSREESAKDDRAPFPQAADKKSQTDTFDSAAAPVAAPGAPSAEPSAPAEARAAPQGFGGQIASSANEVKQLAKTEPATIVFTSPDRRAQWRVGPGGRIEHSADQAQTWQPQTSGVTSDLLAGAAPSEKIAWVVGRAGAILRTQDGEHWQRVTAPSTGQPIASSNPAPDWISVEARDALHATITSRDLRRFATEDGGRTWMPVE
jgi:hypothetical protein